MSAPISLAEFSKRVGALPLKFQPGTQWEYTSAIGFSILGRVVEIVSGMNLNEFLRQRIFTPLDMSNTFFAVPAHRVADVAPVYTMTAERLVKQEAPAPLPAGVEFYSGSGGSSAWS